MHSKQGRYHSRRITPTRRQCRKASDTDAASGFSINNKREIFVAPLQRYCLNQLSLVSNDRIQKSQLLVGIRVFMISED